MGCRRPPKILRISKKYRIFFIIKFLRLLYLLLLKNSSYLINDRWGLRGQSGWLAYWLVRQSSWGNPPSWPSFVIFFIIYGPYGPFNILNSHKILMNWQIVSQGILKFKKCRVKNEVETNLQNCFMRVRNIKRPVWTIENRKKSENTYRESNSFKQPQTASKSHKET